MKIIDIVQGMERGASLFTIVLVVSDENAHLLPFTLESICSQDFPSFDVLVIDGQKSEHSVDIFYAHPFPPVRVEKALEANLFSMMNQGIALASGEYVHFLTPGEFYISHHALSFVSEFVSQHASPDLLYTGWIIHHSLTAPEILLKQIDEQELKEGRISSSLQAYWLRKDALKALQGFNTFYKVQGGLDLLCRLYHHPTLKRAFLRRVLTDYEYIKPTPKKIFTHFWETLFILFAHFGLSVALFWWLAGCQLRLLSWSWNSIKGAFWKRGTI